jgi:hypothetical protein
MSSSRAKGLNENPIAAATHILIKYVDQISLYYGTGIQLVPNRMSIRNISWGVKAAGGYGRLSRNMGDSKLMEPSRPVTEIALPLPLFPLRSGNVSSK